MILVDWRRWAVVLSCSGVLLCGSGCTQTGEGTWEPTGSVSLEARTEVNGVAYRLRDGLFDVTGPQSALLSTEQSPDAPSIDQKLLPGNYSISLRAGFRLEKQFGSAFQNVAATLASENPRTFAITAGQVTPLTYAFDTDGTALPAGDLSVRISVSDTSNPPPPPALSMEVALPMHNPPRPNQTATINPAQVGLFASSNSTPSIQIANNVNIFEGVSTTNWAVVANSGSGSVVLNLGSNTGSVWSVGNVQFPSGSTAIVHGQLRTEGSANESAAQVTITPTIEGTVIDNQTTTLTATFPALSGSPFSINTGSQTISSGTVTSVFVNGGTLTINPGAYEDLVVNGGTVILLPGNYTFHNVTFNGSGTLQSNGVSNFIRVSVRDTMIFRGLCTASTGVPNGFATSNLRWAVFGLGGATVGPAATPSNVFRGTVVAMNGPLIIEGGTRTYRGAFFGQTVSVNAASTVQHIGFTGWETPE